MNNLKYLIILITCLLLFSGCLLIRLYEVDRQFCDFDNKLKIIIGDMYSLRFAFPVMLDRDMVKILGAEPSLIEFKESKMIYDYFFENMDSSNVAPDLHTKFDFVDFENVYKLKEVYLSNNITGILSEKLVTGILTSTCRAYKSIIRKTVIVSLDSIDLKLLPKLAGVQSMLGRPNLTEKINEVVTLYTYKYNLKRINPATKDFPKIAHIEIYYDRLNDQIARIHVSYLRYDVDTHFEEKKIIIKVGKLYDNAQI